MRSGDNMVAVAAHQAGGSQPAAKFSRSSQRRSSTIRLPKSPDHPSSSVMPHSSQALCQRGGSREPGCHSWFHELRRRFILFTGEHYEPKVAANGIPLLPGLRRVRIRDLVQLGRNLPILPLRPSRISSCLTSARPSLDRNL